MIPENEYLKVKILNCLIWDLVKDRLQNLDLTKIIIQ